MGRQLVSGTRVIGLSVWSLALSLAACAAGESPGGPELAGDIDAEFPAPTPDAVDADGGASEVHVCEPGQPETCNGVDDDCDGLTDEDDQTCHCGSLGAPCGTGFECIDGRCLDPSGRIVFVPAGTFWMG
ncbi:MAG: putative metal-binding motif-containing protein [Deltaproteobacteria bacterium]|nr:putative metal-binding motif-containing protein [Deltaproteobacteria bacterium]